jgi:hypothetical protein
MINYGNSLLNVRKSINGKDGNQSIKPPNQNPKENVVISIGFYMLEEMKQ